MDRGGWQVRDLCDETLQVGERPRDGLIAGGGARLLDAAHREEVLDHEALLHFLSRRRGELILRPDRPAADLLATGELDVCVAHDRRDLLLVLHEEDRMYLDVLAG